jgi:hypothetical protein
MEIPFFVIGFIVFLGILTLLALVIAKRKGLAESKDGKYPKSYFLSQGIAIGISLGVPIGLALGNMALGLPFGLAMGYAIGLSLVEKNKDKIRPLTPEEEERKKKFKLLALALVLLGALVFALIYFF